MGHSTLGQFSRSSLVNDVPVPRRLVRPSSVDASTWMHIEPLGGRTGIITLTPELAAHLLAQHGHNRKIRPTSLARIIAWLSEGRFVDLTGGSLMLDSKGDLRGAQHRCTGVVATGVTIRLYVRWDQTEQEIEAENEGGLPWSAGDMETQDIPHKTIRRAITSNLLAMDRAATGEFGPPTKWSPDKHTLVAHMSDPRVVAAARAAVTLRHGVDVLESASGTMYAAFVQSGLGDTDGFFEKLRTGAGLAVGNPILTLRDHLSGLVFAAVRRNAWQTHYAMVIAWNDWTEGRNRRKMYVYDVRKGATKNCTPVALVGWRPFFQ